MSYEDIPSVEKTELLLTDTFEKWRDKFNSTIFSISDSVEVIKDTIEQIPQPETVAERYHASKSTEYGLATEELYGHVRASDTEPKELAERASIGEEVNSFARGDHVHPYPQLSSKATTLEVSRSIDGFNFDGSMDINRRAICSTAGNDAAKVATTFTDNFKLENGVHIYLIFDNCNTANNATLNVNGTGAVPLYYMANTNNNILIQPYQLQANQVYDIMYCGDSWRVLNPHLIGVCHPIWSGNADKEFNNFVFPGEYYFSNVQSFTHSPVSLATALFLTVKRMYSDIIIQEVRLFGIPKNSSGSAIASTANVGPANVYTRCSTDGGTTWGVWDYSYSRILTNASNISTLQSNVSALQTKANTNANNISSLTNSVNNLNTIKTIPGTIVAFSGSFSGRYPIPLGTSTPNYSWVLCDGTTTNGKAVPDLRNRMIIGAKGNYATGATGGSTSHTHTTSGSIGATTLSTNQMPSHQHYVTYSAQSASASFGNSRTWPSEWGNNGNWYTGWTGGSQSHTHSLSLWGTGSSNNLPPYYALAFIIQIK